MKEKRTPVLIFLPFNWGTKIWTKLKRNQNGESRSKPVDRVMHVPQEHGRQTTSNPKRAKTTPDKQKIHNQEWQLIDRYLSLMTNNRKGRREPSIWIDGYSSRRPFINFDQLVVETVCDIYAKRGRFKESWAFWQCNKWKQEGRRGRGG